MPNDVFDGFHTIRGRNQNMETIMNKRTVMFAWVTEEELGWLFTLNELKENKDLFGNQDVTQGLHMLFENMTNEDVEIRNRALLGLSEEGLITMDSEDIFGELEIKDVFITQRGKKLLIEAERILYEQDYGKKNKEERTAKKEKVRKEVFDFLNDYGIPLAVTVIKSVFSKM